MVNDTPAGESTASIPREEMRVFATGAMRDGEAGKLDFDGFLSPQALLRFAQYMDKHRHTPAGLRDSDNWQRGIPLDAYRKSMWRHFFDFWMRARAGQEFGPEIEEDLCALLFNASGYLHEILKRRV